MPSTKSRKRPDRGRSDGGSAAWQAAATLDRVAMPPVGTPCPSCGTPLDSADRFCPACGVRRPEAEPTRAPVAQSFRCDGCGAEIRVEAGKRSYVCPFCDSTYVVEFSPEQSRRQEPEFVIPFAVAPDQARSLLTASLRKRARSRPHELRTAIQAADIRGVYVPAWSFSVFAESAWSAVIGEYWYRTETYTTIENGKSVTRTRQVRETEWWPLAGRFHQYLSGYLVSGSRGVPQNLLDELQPFHTVAVRRYSPTYLAGWECEEYTVDAGAALESCKRQFAARQFRDVGAFMPGDVHRNLEVQTRFRDETSDLILVPVYFIRLQYGGKPYRLLMNGQTGKIVGKMPSQWGNVVGIGVLIGLAVIILGGLLLWLLGR